MENISTRQIMVRRPFRRILPNGYKQAVGVISGSLSVNEPLDNPTYQIITQMDFLREFEPSGHAINDPLVYPDRLRQDPETKEWFRESVIRCAFAFQRIITIKHLVHLCGNDIQFELEGDTENEKVKDTFFKFRTGWAVKDMEIAWYEAAKSVKITGDTAFVGYLRKGIFYWKVLSFEKGDTLYPHFDNVTGKLTLFARSYSDFDNDGNTVTDWLEVWDEKYLRRFRKGKGAYSKIKQVIKNLFGLSGYELVSSQEHGFTFIPVAYHRNEAGACWSPSQDSIEQYELAFSQLSQNNTAYAFPIMYFKGEGDSINIEGGIDGTIKCISMGPDDEAGYLNKQDVSTAFTKQLDTLYKLIYEQSFAVIPPEVRSGDLPGVAIKLLYSPAFENAMKDAQEYNHLIDDMVKIFTYGYGVETENLIDLQNLNVYAWIKPYIHLNESELVQNLAVAVQNGFLSRQTANEQIQMYSNPRDWDRIIKEKKEEQQADLLYELKSRQASVTDNEVEHNPAGDDKL
uniref:Portal protein n=1 Tax=Myoviridae sp. ctXwe21 TaxID=2825123 RepID=A0A8S5PYD9_9CAUD|nr:MAG TPA: portal protein [Myoviridae sp. ctXwe21]